MTAAQAIDVQAEDLRKVLAYAPETGLFTWRVRRGRMVAGSPAGGRITIGYTLIHACGRSYYAHRLAWLFTHGRWPDGEIDHINGDRSDNRIENLRDVSRSQNNQNKSRAISSNCASGLLGVYWHSQRKKWRAQIQVNGKSRHLGLFASKEAAQTAYHAAKRVLHPYWAEEARGR